MEKKTKKRRKGGGRKLADGKISRARLKREAIKWFTYNTSVEGFLRHVSISRQAYYRFLNKYPKLKSEVFNLKNDLIKMHKKHIEDLGSFLRENPGKDMGDFYLRDIEEINLIQIVNKPIEL